MVELFFRLDNLCQYWNHLPEGLDEVSSGSSIVLQRIKLCTLSIKKIWLLGSTYFITSSTLMFPWTVQKRWQSGWMQLVDYQGKHLIKMQRHSCKIPPLISAEMKLFKHFQKCPSSSLRERFLCWLLTTLYFLTIFSSIYSPNSLIQPVLNGGLNWKLSFAQQWFFSRQFVGKIWAIQALASSSMSGLCRPQAEKLWNISKWWSLPPQPLFTFPDPLTCPL